MTDDPLLKVGQVADRLNISASAIRRWVTTGRMPAVRLPSGAIRVRESYVAAVESGDLD